jgi:hypothetical protein
MVPINVPADILDTLANDFGCKLKHYLSLI